MKKLQVIRNSTPPKPVAFETDDAVYIPGDTVRSGSYHKHTGDFSRASYRERLFLNRDGSVRACYSPLFPGDKIILTQEIVL